MVTNKAKLLIDTYVDVRGEYRWRLVNIQNGKIVADSSEGYVAERSLNDAIDGIMAAFESGLVKVGEIKP